MRTTVAFLFLAGFAMAQPPAPAIKPTPVTLKKVDATLGDVAADLSNSASGVAVKPGNPELAKAKCTVAAEGTPFWNALESVADQTKSRLVLRDGGRTVVLEPRRQDRELSSVAGPFRIVPRSVTGRLLLDQGTAFHEIELDVHWEPRVRVYRIDTQPRITKAEDDRGTALIADTGGSHHYPAASHTDMKFRLTGLTRESKQIATLAGEFRATAAEKLLSIPFKNLVDNFPMTQTEAGVDVVLRSFQMIGGTWDAELALTYPEGHPEFESFEEQKWLRDNRLRLIGPGAKVHEPDNDDVVASGRRVAATYRFKLPANANPTGKGWSLQCETPAPLMELKVPFVLKGIPLP